MASSCLNSPNFRVCWGISILALILVNFFLKASSWQDTGRILFLIQQGETEQALKLYQNNYALHEAHDYDLLHRIGLGILDEGFKQHDPEGQLMALFGASIACHDDAYYILEGSLNSRYPQIQYIALQALSHMQSDAADQALLRAMASDYALIRLEAAHQLCLKNHPKAISHTESLMYKTPKQCMGLFPQLCALVDNELSNRLMRRFLNHSSETVRIQAILSLTKNGRDDFLPKIRQLTSQISYCQQEACAYACGILKDRSSIPRLQKLAASQYPAVSLAACQALYSLERNPAAVDIIDKAARQKNALAIQMLGEIEGSEDILLELKDDKDLQVRLNATLALLEKGHEGCLEGLKMILIHDKRDLGFTSISSPGKAFTTWKAVPSSSQILKEDEQALATTITFRNAILTKAQALPEPAFLALADLIFANRQHELIPTLVNLLEESESPAAIALLKKYQQQVGAPFIRQYCNLALYRLKEDGPYGDYLRQWVKNQHQEALIRFQPLPPLELKSLESAYKMEPEEISKLLVEIFQAFAIQQDEEGINTLLDAIINGHRFSKYALAGLILRATQ
jgi:HEAT repeat protein